MKFTADKKMLEKSIIPACFGVAQKNTDPLLEGLYFEASDGVLTICSYDREKGVRTKLLVDIERQGKIVVDAQKISAIVHSLPEGEVHFEADENLVLKITTDEASFQIIGKDASSFPSLPDVKGEYDFTLPQNKIKTMITKTLFAVSNDDTKPVYTGSLYEISGSSLSITALDGFRVAVRKEEGITEREDLNLRFIIPGKAQSDLLRMINDSDEPISVSVAKKHIIFTFENIYYITRLLDGEFLDYKKKIPPTPEMVAVVDTERFIESVERAALIIDERIKNPVKLKFENGCLCVDCATMLGKVNDSFNIEMTGQRLDIGFNHKMLLDALRACGEKKATLLLTHALGPMVIIPERKPEQEQGENPERFLYLILPVQLKET